MPRRTVVESTRKETALEALHLALKRAGRRQRPRPGKPGFTAVEQTMRWWRADWEERSSEQRQTDLFSATSWAKVRQRREAHPDVDTELLPLYVDRSRRSSGGDARLAAESAAAVKRARRRRWPSLSRRSRGAAAVAHGFGPRPPAEVGGGWAGAESGGRAEPRPRQPRCRRTSSRKARSRRADSEVGARGQARRDRVGRAGAVVLPAGRSAPTSRRVSRRLRRPRRAAVLLEELVQRRPPDR